eukprot:TRINITY_DN32931_c0_g1_i1.p2 TRINITY_DN32931_c0_g1~~TRINITY_DN32931_c0_g1_i1.p2  ORF type:complete len:138 (-),score=5.02 TRINITY_DN32931_c0_g1_i1:115-528(-)
MNQNVSPTRLSWCNSQAPLIRKRMLNCLANAPTGLAIDIGTLRLVTLCEDGRAVETQCDLVGLHIGLKRSFKMPVTPIGLSLGRKIPGSFFATPPCAICAYCWFLVAAFMATATRKDQGSCPQRSQRSARGLAPTRS